MKKLIDGIEDDTKASAIVLVGLIVSTNNDYTIVSCTFKVRWDGEGSWPRFSC
jgi:hypothetical protein